MSIENAIFWIYTYTLLDFNFISSHKFEQVLKSNQLLNAIRRRKAGMQWFSDGEKDSRI